MASKESKAITTSEQGRRWLSLREAADFLGIHYTTLRTWADRGEIPTFRTPGGHRRFDLGDLRRFLEERVTQARPVDVEGVVEYAVSQVRQVMAQLPQEERGWREKLGEEERARKREQGRRMFALAMNFVMRPSQRETILEDGRALGRRYGVEAAQGGMSLVEAGRAVQFFRRQLLESVRRDEILDSEDLQIRKLLTVFLDEVLYAMLEGYESVLIGEQKLLKG